MITVDIPQKSFFQPNGTAIYPRPAAFFLFVLLLVNLSVVAFAVNCAYLTLLSERFPLRISMDNQSGVHVEQITAKIIRHTIEHAHHHGSHRISSPSWKILFFRAI
jgi:hypothetical protein